MSLLRTLQRTREAARPRKQGQSSTCIHMPCKNGIIYFFYKCWISSEIQTYLSLRRPISVSYLILLCSITTSPQWKVVRQNLWKAWSSWPHRPQAWWSCNKTPTEATAFLNWAPQKQKGCNLTAYINESRGGVVVSPLACHAGHPASNAGVEGRVIKCTNLALNIADKQCGRYCG